MTFYDRVPISAEEDLAEVYHGNTRFYRYQEERRPIDEVADADLPPVDVRSYASDIDGRQGLPAPQPLSSALTATIMTRTSRRDLTGTALNLADIATLLAHTYGVPNGGDGDSGEAASPTMPPRRTVPSAGARYPLEWFVVDRGLGGLGGGIHHYHPPSHALEVVDRRAQAADAAFAAFLDQPFLDHAAAIFMVGAQFGRTCVKYGERGYRLILLEAGHAMQNLQLAAHAAGLGATALGGFIDDELNALVAMDGPDEGILAAVAIGQLA